MERWAELAASMAGPSLPVLAPGLPGGTYLRGWAESWSTWKQGNRPLMLLSPALPSVQLFPDAGAPRPVGERQWKEREQGPAPTIAADPASCAAVPCSPQLNWSRSDPGASPAPCSAGDTHGRGLPGAPALCPPSRCPLWSRSRVWKGNLPIMTPTVPKEAQHPMLPFTKAPGWSSTGAALGLPHTWVIWHQWQQRTVPPFCSGRQHLLELGRGE